MGIVLLILKILGITILCIIGLVLLVLALLLFVPIRYRIRGSAESKEEYSGMVRLHWLLHAVDVRICIESPLKVTKRIRILGLFGRGSDSVIYPSDDTEESSEEDETDVPEQNTDAEGESSAQSTQEHAGESFEDTADCADSAESAADPATGSAEGGADTAESSENTRDDTSDCVDSHTNPEEKDEAENAEDSSDDDADSEEYDAEEKTEEDLAEDDTAEESPEDAELGDRVKKKLSERVAEWKETASCLLELFTRRKDLLKKYLTKPSTKAAVGKLKKTLLWLLRAIAPRKGHAEVTFGLKDPEKTGKAFAAAALLYPWYCSHVELNPDWSGEALSGNGDVRGRIRLFGVVIRAVSILLDRNIKKVRKEFRYVKDTMKATPEDVKKALHRDAA